MKDTPSEPDAAAGSSSPLSGQAILSEDQLAVLGRLDEALRKDVGLQAACERLVGTLAQLAQLEVCVVYVRRGNLLVEAAYLDEKGVAAESELGRLALLLGSGIAGTAGVQRTPLYVADTRLSGAYLSDTFVGRSEYAVPMIHNGELVGVVDAESAVEDGFSALKRLLMRSASDVATPALANFRLLEAGTNEHALNEAVAELAGRPELAAADIEPGLALLTERTADVLRVDGATIWLLEGDTFLRKDQYLRREKEHNRGGSFSSAALEWAVREKLDVRVRISNDVKSDAKLLEFYQLFNQSIPEELASILHAPIRSGGEVCGVLVAYTFNQPRYWSDSEVAFVASVADIISLGVVTAQKNAAEAALVQAQRLESLGQLAGGVAHDFNNLLTIINGGADLLLADEPSSAGARSLSAEQTRLLGMVSQAGERAQTLTRQLLAFGRKQRLKLGVVDARELMSSALRLGRGAVREDLSIELVLPETPCWVECDGAQIDQTLLNLLINAADALPLGGRLRLSLRQDQGHVVMQVADSGPGVPADVQARVFEPFFTTKGDDGTGLGLAVGYGIVRQHGGELRLLPDSHPELGGAVFELVLPVHAAPVFPDGDIRVTEPNSAQRIGGRVLLLEDEHDVRFVVDRMLHKLGFEAVVARDAGDALRLLEERSISVLVTDVVMPDVRGPELYALALKKHPDLKVLFMSGYAEARLSDLPPDSAQASYLAKPFSLETLENSLFELFQQQSENSPVIVEGIEAPPA